MAYKLGLMLSMVFVISVMLLGGDIICVSSIHSTLDSLALVIGRKIAMEGTVSPATKQLAKEHNAIFSCPNVKTPAIGENITFYLGRWYSSFVLSSKDMLITVKRSVIVGYYMN